MAAAAEAEPADDGGCGGRFSRGGMANGMANGMTNGMANGMANGMTKGMANGMADSRAAQARYSTLFGTVS